MLTKFEVARLKYHQVQDICWKRNVFVHQKPTTKGGFIGPDVILIIDFNGTKRYGKKKYKQNSEELLRKIEQVYRHLLYYNVMKFQ